MTTKVFFGYINLGNHGFRFRFVADTSELINCDLIEKDTEFFQVCEELGWPKDPRIVLTLQQIETGNIDGNLFVAEKTIEELKEFYLTYRWDMKKESPSAVCRDSAVIELAVAKAHRSLFNFGYAPGALLKYWIANYISGFTNEQITNLIDENRTAHFEQVRKMNYALAQTLKQFGE